MPEVHPIKTYHLSWSNYSYLVVDPSECIAVVVDPAWELDKFTRKLGELNLSLKAILLTHSHHDHVNLIDPLIDLFSPQIYMSKEEIDYYQFRCRNLNPLLDNERVSIGELKIEGLLTAGHTAGSMCYLIGENLFSGDTLFTEGCGICTERGGSVESMFKSIQRIKAEMSPHIRVYPGHSYGKLPGQTIEYLFKNNIYFQIEKKEHFVNFRMRENQKNLFQFE